MHVAGAALHVVGAAMHVAGAALHGVGTAALDAVCGIPLVQVLLLPRGADVALRQGVAVAFRRSDIAAALRGAAASAVLHWAGASDHCCCLLKWVTSID
jgi:hypothetical protein